MIDYRTLVFTLGLLLAIVALTTAAAVVNKIVSNREDDSKRRFLADLRKRFLQLRTSPGRAEAMPGIVASLSGRWSELAAAEIAQLELPMRLDVLHALERSGAVSRCIRDTRSRFKWTRAHALRILGELKLPPSVPALLEALGDRDADVRNVAARSLGRMKVQAAEEALIALLGKHDQAVSARIAAICIEMGPRTAPLLVKTLRDGSPRARFWAARILGEIQDPRATRSLAEALADPDADVRSASLRALGNVADSATLPMIRPLLGDPAWYVRAHAAEALGKIGDSAPASALGDALRDRSWWVRKNALDALVRIGEPAKPVLLRSLESDDRFARDCAVEGLTAFGVRAIAPRREGD
jgi:HEAT repeat protein